MLYLFFPYNRSVPLSYQWDITFPSTSKDNDEDAEDEEGDGGDEFSIFQIHPSTGVLDEQAIQTFHVRFSPDSVSFRRILSLIRLPTFTDMINARFFDCAHLFGFYSFVEKSIQ